MELKSRATRVDSAQKEYLTSDQSWLMFHYWITIGIVVFAFIAECLMSSYSFTLGILKSPLSNFNFERMIIPTVLNVICLVMDTIVIKKANLNTQTKIYIVSLIFTFICFVLLNTHNNFTTSFYFFSGAIILTMIYAVTSLTLLIAVVCLLMLSCSEIFITGNVYADNIFTNSTRLGNFMVALTCLIFITFVGLVIVQYEKKKKEVCIQLQKERIWLQDSLNIDELTQLYNRRALNDAIRNFEGIEAMQERVFCIIDLDNFKDINDQLGHQAGDECLIQLASVLKNHCEKGVPYRYGGDEFCIIFHDTCMEEAVIVCERLQKKVKDIKIKDNKGISMTISIGLTECKPDLNFKQVFIQADKALYNAKINRNNISY